MQDESYGVLPEGPEWRCTTCKRSYPADYEPARCECGHPLTRVLASFRTAMAAEVDGGNAMLDAREGRGDA